MRLGVFRDSVIQLECRARQGIEALIRPKAGMYSAQWMFSEQAEAPRMQDLVDLGLQEEAVKPDPARRTWSAVWKGETAQPTPACN